MVVYAQCMKALDSANEVRLFRAALKRGIGSRTVNPVSCVHAPPPMAEGMLVFDLLLSVPRVGVVKARKLMRSAKVGPTTTLGGLTPGQREDLGEALADDIARRMLAKGRG